MGNRLEVIGLVLLAGSALGSTAVVTRIGIAEIPPLILVTLRLIVAALTFAAVIALRRRSLPDTPQAWRDSALVGIAATGIPVVAFTLALQYISSGVLTIIISLIPTLTGITAHLLLAHERLTIRKVGGLGVALVGVLLIVVTGTTGLAGGAGDFRGHILALAGVLTTVAGFVYTRLRLQHLDAVVLAGIQTWVGVLIAVPLAVALSGPVPTAAGPSGWFAVAYTGLVGSFVGFLVLFLLVKRFGATTASLPGYVVPVVATLLGALVLKELITAPLLGGAAMVLSGVFLVSS